MDSIKAKYKKEIDDCLDKSTLPNQVLSILDLFTPVQALCKIILDYQKMNLELCNGKNQIYYLKDGKRHGKWIGWYENGIKWWEHDYIDGKEHGKLIQWHKNGERESEVNCIDGKRHGKSIIWYEDGNKEAETDFVDGKKHGKEVYWYRNGRVAFENFYDNGKEYYYDYMDGIGYRVDVD